MELPVWRQPMSSAESRATRDEELLQRLETSAPAEHRQTTPATQSRETKRMPCPPRMGHAIAPKRDPTGARASRATGR